MRNQQLWYKQISQSAEWLGCLVGKAVLSTEHRGQGTESTLSMAIKSDGRHFEQLLSQER